MTNTRIRLRKDRVVSEWWNECIIHGTQTYPLSTITLTRAVDKMHMGRHAAHRPNPDRPRWFEEVSTDTLFGAWSVWASKACPWLKDDFEKRGFMMMFFRVAKDQIAGRSTVTHNGKRIQIVRFKGEGK